MAIKTQAETFRTYGKVCALTAQTAVECRFGGEAERILSAHASVALTGAEAGNGEVRYFGKVCVTLVYEDGEKRVCSGEKGVEFTARAVDERLFPALTPIVTLAVETVSTRREGASIYVTALIGADIALYGERAITFLSGGEFIGKHEPVSVFTSHLCSGTAEAEDEFETEDLGDVLLHSERAIVTDVDCRGGVLTVDGEISLNVLALKGEGGLTSFERLVPFRAELVCDGAEAGRFADVNLSVTDVKLQVLADEEKEKSRLTATISLSLSACVTEEVVIDGIVDAFSPQCRTRLSYEEWQGVGAGEYRRIVERVSGKAILSESVDFSDTFRAVTLSRAEANVVKEGEGCLLEGIATATLFTLSSDGSHKSVEMSLPFSLPIEDCGNNRRVDVLACGISARQRKEGEVDGEVTLKITVKEEKSLAIRLLNGIEEGEAIVQRDSAVSVYVPRAGDGLWELSKSLQKSPDEVLASNPDLQFPIQEGQRVVVYRKKSLQ